MRVTQGPPNGFRVKAYAGTTGVLLAMNMPVSMDTSTPIWHLRRHIEQGATGARCHDGWTKCYYDGDPMKTADRR